MVLHSMLRIRLPIRHSIGTVIQQFLFECEGGPLNCLLNTRHDPEHENPLPCESSVAWRKGC